jgi:hypothetical protein
MSKWLNTANFSSLINKIDQALDLEVDVSGLTSSLTTNIKTSAASNISSWFGDDADSILAEAEAENILEKAKQDSKMMKGESFNSATLEINPAETDANDNSSATNTPSNIEVSASSIILEQPSSVPDLSKFTGIPLMEVVGQPRRKVSTSTLESIPEIQHDEEGDSSVNILELRETQLMSSMKENSRLREQIAQGTDQLKYREIEIAREIKDLKRLNEFASQDCTSFIDQIAQLKGHEKERTGELLCDLTLRTNQEARRNKLSARRENRRPRISFG